MNIRYTIMQKTPMPGYWQPIPVWQVQHAEVHMNFNRRHYYERAVRLGDWNDAVFLYSYEDAQRIVEYWKGIYPFAKFMLMAQVQ